MLIVIYSIFDVEGKTGKKFVCESLSAKPSLNKVFIIIIIITRPRPKAGGRDADWLTRRPEWRAQ